MTRESTPNTLPGAIWDRQIFDSLPVALFVNNLDGRLVYANRLFGEWYGYPPDSVVGKSSFDLWPDDQAERSVALDAEVIATGQVVRGESRYQDRDGAERRLLVTKFPIHDAHGAVVGVGTTNTDVTSLAGSDSDLPPPDGTRSEGSEIPARPTLEVEQDLHRETRARRRAESALRTSQRRLQSMADSLPVLMVHYDLMLRYQFVNQTYCAWHRTRPSDVIGRSVEQVVGPALFRRTRVELERALAGERVRFEYEHRFADGQRRTIQGDLIPERDTDDRVISVFGVGTDVTALKDLEDQLLHQERLAALGQVTATVAHELRTPLGTIDTSSAVLRSRLGDVDAGTKRVFERLERNVRRCNGIIEELLSFTRTNRSTLRRTRFDAWVADCLDDYEMPPGVDLHRALDSDAHADLDPNRLAQALTNIMDNALNAMLESGTEVTAHRLDVRTRVSGSRVELIVADTGPGIAPEAREKLFEPFFSTRVVGVGLGLALVRQVMKEHHGGAEVLETGAGGTTLMMWMPIASGDPGSGCEAGQGSGQGSPAQST